jgi:hypothetical protein
MTTRSPTKPARTKRHPLATWTSQEIIGIQPAEIAKAIFGLTLPINTASDFVLAPVSQLVAPGNPVVAAAIRLYEAAGGDLTPGAPAGNIASRAPSEPDEPPTLE